MRTGLGSGRHLESKEPEDGFGEGVGWADAVGDDAFAFHFDLETAEGGGGDDVVWADVSGAGYAADDDVFVLVVEEDLPLGFNDEVAVGENGDDLAGEAGGEGGVGGGLALAFEGGVGVGGQKRIDAVGGDAAGEAGDGRVGGESAGAVYVSALGGGGLDRDEDDDVVVEVAGFVVGAGIGEGAGGGPETTWCTWVGVGLSVLLEPGEVFFPKIFGGLLFG